MAGDCHAALDLGITVVIRGPSKTVTQQLQAHGLPRTAPDLRVIRRTTTRVLKMLFRISKSEGLRSITARCAAPTGRDIDVHYQY